jgi:hypothetical protein
VDQGITDKEAKSHTTDVMANSDKKMFIDMYQQILIYTLTLEHSNIHHTILTLAQQLYNTMDVEQATKAAIRRHLYLFDFDDLMESSEEEETDKETSEDEEATEEEQETSEDELTEEEETDKGTSEDEETTEEEQEITEEELTEEWETTEEDQEDNNDEESHVENSDDSD